MRSLLPRSLRAQLLLLILTALILAQGLSLWLFADERSLAVRAVLAQEAAVRAASVAVLLDEAPTQLRSSILRAADSPLVRFSVNPQASVEKTHQSAGRVATEIRHLIGTTPGPEVRVSLQQRDMRALPPMPGASEQMSRMHRAMNTMQITSVSMQISIALQDGTWLNVMTQFRRPPYQLAWTQAASFAVTAALIAAALWLALGRLIRPLGRLAGAADKFGRGEDVDTITPSGPEELRRLTDAFNEMQTRLKRFIEDRTRLLAALGHDLRSPLTALRVRAELVDEAETRERLIATVEEMQEMVEATLSFARGIATNEPAQTIDLGVFIGDLTREMAETGGAVRFRLPADATLVRLRPTSARRALRNVIENALRYGEKADIRIETSAGLAHVLIEDQGPGIPQADLEKVFDPFVRLETSRSRETGGMGLGLSIVRTIIRAHGGETTLVNRPQGGLSVRVSLPIAETRELSSENKGDVT